MKKFINVKPVHQTGHNCKTTAIASVDKYFGEQLGFEPIPLHKKGTAPTSIKRISKSKGSVQGELLEIRQLPEIFAELGYETELVDIQDDYQSFQNQVINTIQQGNLIVACFAVDRQTGLPSTHYERNNEHAAILHGFDEETGELDFTHWDRQRKTTMSDFYNSSMTLLNARNPEYYVNIKSQNREMKYDLHRDQSGQSFTENTLHKKTITPTQNSGFRGKLLIIKQPQLQKILDARQQLLDPENNKARIAASLTEVHLKIDELIHKGNQKHRRAYQKVSQVAATLNSELEQAKNQFFEGTLSFEQFRQQCTKAIATAEPEFAQHRGWHKLDLTLRKYLGVLATITLFPRVIVAMSSKHGYEGTFFKTPKTDAAEKLDAAKQNLNKFRPNASN